MEITHGHFDGITLDFYHEDGSLAISVPAVSGRQLAQNPDFQGIEETGPIPEGEWTLSTAINRTWNPFDNDNIQVRGDEGWGFA